MKSNYAKKRLRIAFVLGVALILVIAISIVVVLEYLIIQIKLVEKETLQSSGLFLIILFGFSSVVIGVALSAILEKFIVKPVDTLIDGMAKLSDGEFSTRIDMGKVKGMKEISDTFNTLATQLENTEILRSDFVNNFSHELKTPIVSVSGLVDLLKNENLPQEKRKKYLEIIEEEMDRLSDMTTNLLNLSKVEKQEILTDKTTFNISEQIRTCVLLLEKKWSKKDIEFSLDFDEFYVLANYDLLKQVWFNLIDNAIKFSNEKGKIVISISQKEKEIEISISNNGRQILEEDKTKIFNKFYQGKNASSGEGNGIGLSIVKHIVDMHGGKIYVECGGDTTTFTTFLINN